MKRLTAVLMSSLLGGPLFAQDTQERFKYDFEPKLTVIQPTTKRIADKKFWAVSAGLGLTAVYDIETTYHALNNCNCREGNPIMRPFVNHGRPAAYAVSAAMNTAAMLAAYKLKKNHPKIWWIIPVCFTAGHVFAGSSNLILARQPR